MPDNTSVTQAKEWCNQARKELGLGFFSSDGRDISNRAAAIAKSLGQLQKLVASGKIPLSDKMVDHYKAQFIGIAKDLKKAASKQDREEVERQSLRLEELKRELAVHQSKNPKERAQAEQAFEAQMMENLKRDQEKSKEIEEAYNKAKEAYEKAYPKAIKPITKVTADKDLAVIGGGAVLAQLNDAIALASRNKWAEANIQLELALKNAKLVEARRPYIVARRAHEEDIKAAMEIKYPTKGESYGAQMKKLWEKAEAAAKGGNYSEAAKIIKAAAKMITDRIDKDQGLKEAQEKVETERNANMEQMKKLISKGKPDKKSIEELRAMARKELQTYSKDAAALGQDPAAPSRLPCDKPAKAKELFENYDWFALKDMLHDEDNDKVTKEVMWDLWRYRQDYVTKLIDKLRGEFPGLIAKASGSADMESDIDITFASANPGDEVKAAKKFNDEVLAAFKKPAGRVFDVNIYPRDYSAIRESFNQDYNIEAVQDRNIDQPVGEMGKLSQVDQDVATLLKQRRFLDEASFKKLYEDVLKSTNDKAIQEKIRKQYEEGEDIYLLTSIEKIEAIVAKLKEKKVFPIDAKEHPRAAKAYDAYADLKKNADKGDKSSLVKMQKLLPVLLDELEDSYKAEVMETTDDMYLVKMADLRKKQSRVALLENEDANYRDHHPDQSCDQAHANKDHEAWRKEHG